jgi:hypothetical protein
MSRSVKLVAHIVLVYRRTIVALRQHLGNVMLEIRGAVRAVSAANAPNCDIAMGRAKSPRSQAPSVLGFKSLLANLSTPLREKLFVA